MKKLVYQFSPITVNPNEITVSQEQKMILKLIGITEDGKFSKSLRPAIKAGMIKVPGKLSDYHVTDKEIDYIYNVILFGLINVSSNIECALEVGEGYLDDNRLDQITLNLRKFRKIVKCHNSKVTVNS